MTYTVIFILTAICAYTDYKEYKIYDIITLPVLVGGMVYHLTIGNGALFFLKGISVGAVLLFLAIVTNQIGPGDGKLIMAIGAFSGWLPALIILYFSFVIAGIGVMLSHLRKRNMEKLPFGVFIFLGVIFIKVILITIRG